MSTRFYKGEKEVEMFLAEIKNFADKNSHNPAAYDKVESTQNYPKEIRTEVLTLIQNLIMNMRKITSKKGCCGGYVTWGNLSPILNLLKNNLIILNQDFVDEIEHIMKLLKDNRT